jgi:hypothetical protein
MKIIFADLDSRRSFSEYIHASEKQEAPNGQ